MRAHRWTARLALLACGVALLLSQVPSAAAQTVAVATAESDWPTLTLRLALRGPVPANVFFMHEEGTSGTTICEPKSVQADYPGGPYLPPPCENGRIYVVSFPVPPGARVEYRWSIGFYADADGGETYGQRVIWSDVVVMGSSDYSVTVTHRFAVLPETDTAAAARQPSPPRGPAGLGLLALMAGLGLTANRRSQRHRRAR